MSNTLRVVHLLESMLFGAFMIALALSKRIPLAGNLIAKAEHVLCNFFHPVIPTSPALFQSQTSTDTDTETIINEDGGLANIYQADCAQENMYESVGSRSTTLDNRRSQSLSHPSSSVDVPELPARRKLKNRSSAMDLLHRSANGRRSMWGELPEVIDSGILGE